MTANQTKVLCPHATKNFDWTRGIPPVAKGPLTPCITPLCTGGLNNRFLRTDCISDVTTSMISTVYKDLGLE